MYIVNALYGFIYMYVTISGCREKNIYDGSSVIQLIEERVYKVTDG